MASKNIYQLHEEYDAIRLRQIALTEEVATRYRDLVALLTYAWGHWEEIPEDQRATIRQQLDRIDNEFLTLPWEEEGSWQANITAILESLKKE